MARASRGRGRVADRSEVSRRARADITAAALAQAGLRSRRIREKTGSLRRYLDPVRSSVHRRTAGTAEISGTGGIGRLAAPAAHAHNPGQPVLLGSQVGA